MEGEPRGGWGRTINGGDRTVKALQARDLPALAQQLDAHLDSCRVARKLQPKAIFGLDDAEVRSALSRLRTAGLSEVPKETVLALLNRRAKHMRTCLLKQCTKEDMLDYLAVIAPWPTPGVPAEYSDPMSIHLSQLKGYVDEEDGCVFFESAFVTKILVPFVGDGNMNLLLCMAEGLTAVLKDINLLQVGPAQASLISQMSDVLNVLFALQLPIGLCKLHLPVIKKINKMVGIAGSTPLHRMATARDKTDFLTHLRAVENAESVLLNIMPEVEASMAELDALAPSCATEVVVRSNILTKAAGIVLRHSEVAPPGLFDPSLVVVAGVVVMGGGCLSRNDNLVGAYVV